VYHEFLKSLDIRKDKHIATADLVDNFEEKFWMREASALRRTEALVAFIENPVKPIRKYAKRKTPADRTELMSDEIEPPPKKLEVRPESDGEDTDGLLEDSKKIKKTSSVNKAIGDIHYLPPAPLYHEDEKLIAEELQRLQNRYHYDPHAPPPPSHYEESHSGQSFDYRYGHHYPENQYDHYVLPPIQGMHPSHSTSNIPTIQSPITDYGPSPHGYHPDQSGAHRYDEHPPTSQHHSASHAPHGNYQALPPMIRYPHQQHYPEPPIVPLMKRPMFEEDVVEKKQKREGYPPEQYYQ
jgi:hypothetical protein